MDNGHLYSVENVGNLFKTLIMIFKKKKYVRCKLFSFFVYQVPLEDMYNGSTRKLALQKSVICSKCDGMFHF